MAATTEAGSKRTSRTTPRSVLRVSDFAALYEASLSTQGALNVIHVIRSGVPATDVTRIAHSMGTTKEQLIKTLDLPRATVDRKAKAHQNLSSEQSERVVGMAKLVGQVQAMIEGSGDATGFNAAQWIAHWLEQPLPALGGRPPAELMDTVAGQRIVSDLLAKMQSGAYA
ncbi:type II RES/Xre toxin-antitoxin system antitoxin (plasmid) [Cupriavidus basilensis]